MASTSDFNNGRQPENDATDASQSIPAAPSASPTFSAVTLFSSCFAWLSSFFSTPTDLSISTAPTSTPASQSQNELTNAFQGMAPYPLYSGTRKLPYDVFINHRGPDVKKTLATTLYNTLHGMGLRVFLDSEELELGDSLPKELEEAMRSASLHLAIFSKNYAQSPWCLAELAFMLKTGTQIVPVFYHIQTGNVRYASGVFADAFSQHEKKRRHTPEKIREWKDALYHVSYNTGHVVNTENDEVDLLKKIVNFVLDVIKNVPFVVAKHPVGLDEALNAFDMTIHSVEQQHPVHIVGLWGMGGSGKTTLAKHFYNNKYKTIEKHCFLFDVRDAAHKSVLHTKQKELLEALGFKDVQVTNVEVGKAMIASRLRSVEVFIVVDDVDNVEQLDALLPIKDSFGWGSLIVVTTREFEVLRSWGISTVHKMKTLDPHYAQQLFCWHAFLQSFPLEGFESLVEKFLNVCDGLPLSLKVFGALLYGKFRKDYWMQQLNKISRILPKDIKQRLKVSYDALNDEEKEIFLDIACFFTGEEKILVITVWDGSRWNGLHSWERLQNKCLVELDDNDHIRMHDHLRDLGREIANQHLPCRIWFPYQIIKVHTEAQRVCIRGITSTAAGSTSGFGMFPQCSLGGEVIVNTSVGSCSLSPSSLGLKVFQVRGNYYNQLIGVMSEELLWLRWLDIGQKSLGSLSLLKNLRVLDLREKLMRDNHLEELWETDTDAPVQLRGLVIDECSKFQRFPSSIGRLIHLKKMVVNFAFRLKSLPEEFCLLQSLEHLELSACSELSSLPSGFGNLKSLRHLSLNVNREFKMLPDSCKDLILLQHLDLCYCDTLTLQPSILENITKLKYVKLSECKQLEVLPSHITKQGSLRELYLGGCSSLREMPMNIGQLSKLQVLEIGSQLLLSLPTSLEDLSSLTNLRIENCPKLECLPDHVGRLNLLENLDIISSGLKSLPNSLKQLSSLQKLVIYRCPISELNLRMGSFTSSLSNLKWITLSGLKVSKISISQDCCPVLETLDLRNIHQLTEIEVLPAAIKDLCLQGCEILKNISCIVDLVNIEKLRIIKCLEVGALPSFAQLASLKEFVLRGTYGVSKIQGLENCTALEELAADTRWKVQGIESLKHMERLRRVELRANRKSGVQSCIQSIQKLAGEIIVCTQAVPDAAFLVNSFAFPRHSLVDSIANQNIYYKPRLVQKRSPNGDAIIVCFVINCVTPRMQFRLSSVSNEISSTEVDGGRWVWACFFTQSSRSHRTEEYVVEKWGLGEGDVEKGLILMGEEQRLLEVFRGLWMLLAN